MRLLPWAVGFVGILLPVYAASNAYTTVEQAERFRVDHLPLVAHSAQVARAHESIKPLTSERIRERLAAAKRLAELGPYPIDGEHPGITGEHARDMLHALIHRNRRQLALLAEPASAPAALDALERQQHTDAFLLRRVTKVYVGMAAARLSYQARQRACRSTLALGLLVGLASFVSALLWRRRRNG